MAPSGYLTTAGIDTVARHLPRAYPSLCRPVALPERSVEGRVIRAFRLAAGTAGDRRGVLFIGGTHARELVNPDLLLSLAVKLCQAYQAGSSLVFGPKVYPAGMVKLILESAELFFIPLLNPDGRAWVQDPGGYPMWRKNRRVNAGSSCRGVDLNRNFDFLHSSGIGTSSDPCSDVFRGPGAFSEPETRNVRALLDANPQIRAMVDVHSYLEKVLHPWGDDASQTTDPAQNFQNPAFDGRRGNPNDTVYREYIPAGDLSWLVRAGTATADAIRAVRGRAYRVEPAVQLYPTSGTSKDYVYARHFVDTGKTTVYGYTIETGREFQPPYAEALEITKEVSAGLVQFTIQVMCLAAATAVATTRDATAGATAGSVDATARLRPLRELRDRVLLGSRAGRELVALTDLHSGEMIEALAADENLRARAVAALTGAERAVGTAGGAARLPKGLLGQLDAIAADLAGRSGATAALRQAVDRVRRDLPVFAGQSISDALATLDRRPPPRPGPTRLPPTPTEAVPTD